MPDAYPVFDSANSKQEAAFAKLLAEVQVIHDNATRNLGALVNPDPAKEYIWAHNTPEDIASKMGMGYEIVRDGKNDKPTVSINWRKNDGSYVRGDLILMSCDKERHRMLKLYGELKAIQNLRASRVPILQKARQAGIRVEVGDDDGASVSFQE